MSIAIKMMIYETTSQIICLKKIGLSENNTFFQVFKHMFIVHSCCEKVRLWSVFIVIKVMIISTRPSSELCNLCNES